MKKVLSGILALMLAGALTVPAFAEAGSITAAEVTTTVANEPEATVAPESLKEAPLTRKECSAFLSRRF